MNCPVFAELVYCIKITTTYFRLDGFAWLTYLWTQSGPPTPSISRQPTLLLVTRQASTSQAAVSSQHTIPPALSLQSHKTYPRLVYFTV